MQEKLENYKHYSTSNRRTSDIFMGTTFQLHLNTYTLSFSEEKKMCTVLGKPVSFFSSQWAGNYGLWSSKSDCKSLLLSLTVGCKYFPSPLFHYDSFFSPVKSTLLLPTCPSLSVSVLSSSVCNSKKYVCLKWVACARFVELTYNSTLEVYFERKKLVL